MNYHKSSLTILMVSAVATVTSTAVFAKEPAGSYINLYVGPSSLSSTNLNESRPAPAGLVSGKATFSSGLGLGGAYGYRYGNGWAAEIQWDYRRHDLKNIGGSAFDGDFASNILFVNGYYRFDKMGSVRPFVGAGIGWAQEVDIDISRNGQELSYSRSGGAALQAIVGAEIEMSSRWSLIGDVRWTRVNSGTFKAENASSGGVLTGKPKYQPVSLNLGVTYKF